MARPEAVGRASAKSHREGPHRRTGTAPPQLPIMLTSSLDTSDTLDGRYGKSLYVFPIGDFPEEVSNPSKVSRGWEGNPPDRKPRERGLVGVLGLRVSSLLSIL
jgi:hypothetical protein